MTVFLDLGAAPEAGWLYSSEFSSLGPDDSYRGLRYPSLSLEYESLESEYEEYVDLRTESDDFGSAFVNATMTRNTAVEIETFGKSETVDIELTS